MTLRPRSGSWHPAGRRRGATALVAAVATVAWIAATQGALAQPLDEAAVLAQARAPKSATGASKPSGANPYLSFLPAGVEPNYPAWSRWLAGQGKAKNASLPPADPTRLIVAGEAESNGTQASANFVGGFGTGPGDDDEADLSGTLTAGPAPTLIGPFAEDNGSIPLASATGLGSGAAVKASGTIGDGPYGSGGTGSGDFDFFVITGLAAGDEIVIDVDTPLPFCCDLDPFVSVFDSTGALLAFNDDDGSTYDSFLAYQVPAAGTYYVGLGAYLSPFPSDRFNSASGLGAASEGTYDITIGLNSRDRDFFSFDLEPGDVIAANVLGLAAGARVTLFDPSGVARMGSGQDASSIQPGPFPGGGPLATYVAETAGTWAVQVSSQTGAYTLRLRAFRPPLEQQFTGSAQTLFVDFDGATIDPAIFGATPGSAVLSPLASFLAGWGLLPGDESAVIDAIMATIEENLSTDMRVFAANGDYDVTNIPGDFDVVLLNSRDHADPFGNPNVSRLIIGGTIPELTISTIGIAESIDTGNFASAETAVVLLDLLSAPAFDPNSLNQFPLGGGATKIDLVGAGVGNIASHEAGHFFANFHTDQFNALPCIMDQGGNLPNIVGVGPDLSFGTADDPDVDFEADTFVPNEGFTGNEDTLNAVAFGLSTGTQVCPPAPLGTCLPAGKAALLIKDNTNPARDSLVFKWQKGASTTQGDLGDPTSTAAYRICVYDATGLVRSATAPAGGLCDGDPCWKTTGPLASPNGLKYRDRDLTPDGTSSIVLKSGATPKPKLIWKAKGGLLDDGPLGLVGPVVVEVGHSDGPVCFGQSFGPGDVVKNTSEQFKASAP